MPAAGANGRRRPASTPSSSSSASTRRCRRDGNVQASTSPAATARSSTTSATCPAAASTCCRPRAPDGDAHATSRAALPDGRHHGARPLVRRDQTVVFSMKKSGDDHYHIYTDAHRQRRDPPEDVRRPRRHQPDLHPRRPHRVRDERDVHRDGHARRRVQPRPRRHAARDDHRRRRRRRSQALLAEPLAHRQPVPPLRRHDRLLALGAPRRRQRREALPHGARLHADDRRRRPARQALQLAGAGDARSRPT